MRCCPVEAEVYLVGEELLVDLALVDLLLYGATGDEAVDSHLLALAYSPGTLPGLHVCRGVPVGVIYHHPAAAFSLVQHKHCCKKRCMNMQVRLKQQSTFTIPSSAVWSRRQLVESGLTVGEAYDTNPHSMSQRAHTAVQ